MGNDGSFDDTVAGGRAATASDLDAMPDVDPAFYGNREVLSQGGMGRIFTARDRRLQRTVAIKELLSSSDDLRARFTREVLLTARLQHPSIIGVHEAGRWPSGDPFYAMELVRGRPLDELIGEARTLEARMALLPHVIAVADALGFAHVQRVLHRDLKPNNVMVGSHGETVVIDWGLAKDLSRPDDVEPASPYRDPASSGEAGLTSVGDVMGTPMYMPPEQAHGERVDERADVYAIGAMLYHLLAGSGPYKGDTSVELLACVIQGPPPPLEDRAPDVPPDLVAIVRRAMARSAGDRYATARELAEDLRRFQAGQLVGAHRYSLGELLRRWLRRHLRILAVTATAVVVLAGFGAYSVRRIVHERAVAEAERRVAVASRAQADRLIDFMLVDLKDRLEPLGRLDLLAKVSTEAATYYGDTPRAARDDERRRSFALELRGDVELSEGKSNEALVHYRASQAITDALARDPSDGLARRELVAGAIKIGDVLATRGDSSGALAMFRSAVAGAATIGDDARGRATRATASERLAKALARSGDHQAALREARAARDERARLVAAAPDDAEAVEALAISAVQLGDLIAEADGPGALAEYRAVVELSERGARGDATNAHPQRMLSVAHARIAAQLMQREDYAAALAESRLALAISERLAAADPTNASRQRDLALDRRSVADALAATGDAAGALVVYREALAIRKHLAELDPANGEARRDLAVGHGHLGDGLMTSDPAAALVEYRSALALAIELAKADPSSAERRRDVEVAHDKVGDALAATKDRAGAKASYQAALVIARALLAEDPSQLRWSLDVALTVEYLGNLALAADDYAAARDAFAEVASLRAAANGSDAAARHQLAGAHDGLGEALAGLGDAVGARRERAAVIAILEELAAAHPADKRVASELAAVRAKLGAP